MAERKYICPGCRGPRTISHEIPGGVHYAPCEFCKAVGIQRVDPIDYEYRPAGKKVSK